ncbi:MAG: hypothetical protein ACHQ2F_14545 [Desulfobaccales bacterium]
MKKGYVFLAIAAMIVMTMPIAWATIIPSTSINDLPEGSSVLASSEISSAHEDHGNGYNSLTGNILSDSLTNCTWAVALTEPDGEGWTNQTISDFMTLTGSYGGFGEKTISLTFWPDNASGQTDALETFQVQGAR